MEDHRHSREPLTSWISRSWYSLRLTFGTSMLWVYHQTVQPATPASHVQAKLTDGEISSSFFPVKICSGIISAGFV